eukprot:428347_1
MPRLASKGCFRSRTFKVVIADESHAIKTLDAQRTVATLPVLQKANHVICLSGTPVLSRPAEIFTTLRALLPNVYLESDWIPFADRYCDAKHGRFGLDTSGCSNSSELKLLLEGTVMLRRLKRDVLKQLPEKKREVITVRISQAQRPELDELLAEKKANDAAIKEAKSIGDDNTLFRLDVVLITYHFIDICGPRGICYRIYIYIYIFFFHFDAEYLISSSCFIVYTPLELLCLF